MTVMHLIVLASIRYPDFVPWVQDQLDKVVGTERLPTFADEHLLPNVTAIIRGTLNGATALARQLILPDASETLRWRSPIPVWGHTSIEDDVVEFNGKSYFIPAKTLVMALAR